MHMYMHDSVGTERVERNASCDFGGRSCCPAAFSKNAELRIAHHDEHIFATFKRAVDIKYIATFRWPAGKHAHQQFGGFQLDVLQAL